MKIGEVKKWIVVHGWEDHIHLIVKFKYWIKSFLNDFEMCVNEIIVGMTIHDEE